VKEVTVFPYGRTNFSRYCGYDNNNIVITKLVELMRAAEEKINLNNARNALEFIHIASNVQKNYDIEENWEINIMLSVRDQVTDVVSVSNTEDYYYYYYYYYDDDDDNCDDNCDTVHLLLQNPIRMS
jgi:hypothetical protein